MHPILFEIGPVRIYSYGIMLVIGFFAAMFFMSKQAKAAGIKPDFVYDLCFVSFIWGIAGARIFYVVLNMDYYWSKPLEIFALHRGGLVFFGGLLSGFTAGALYARKKRFSPAKILDLAAPFIALAHSIGRIGCFLNGCCYGKPTDIVLGVRFPGDALKRHPVQLYEAGALFLLFLALKAVYAGKNKSAGITFAVYLIMYSAWRFLIEYLRADHYVYPAGLTIYQIISVIIFITAALFIFYKRKKNL